MAKTINLEGERGKQAFLALLVATNNEQEPVKNADRLSYIRLQDAIESVSEVGEDEDGNQTTRLDPDADALGLEEAEFDLLRSRYDAIDEYPPHMVRWFVAADEVLLEVEGQG